MAPVSNSSGQEINNNNGGAGGGNPSINGSQNGSGIANGGGGSGGQQRQTGTVPKTKSSRKHSVPQEIVAPTRRDLQQHLNDLVNWASSSSQQSNNSLHRHHHHHSKPRNARTPGEGTCFELDNLSLQDHANGSRFIPVRPIVRRNLGTEELQGDHQNTAIGVVIPTTPSQQLQNHRPEDHLNSDPIFQQLFVNRQRDSNTSSFRIPDGAPALQAAPPSRGPGTRNSDLNKNIDDRIQEIQDYIRATSSLITSIQHEKANLEAEFKEIREGDMVNDNSAMNQPINSIHLETLGNSSDSEISGPRPQSVASIHSTGTPNTPTYEDLQHKLQSSNRNMQMIRDQQNQILRLQQAAKSQLEELEKVRAQNPTSNLLSHETEPPNYDTVNQVQDDVGGLMNRMRSLTTFIQNQNELASLLGEDLATEEILNEQAMLQKKLQELKMKKGQMDNLVTDLQSMNVQADQNFGQMPQTPGSENGNRIVPIALERIVPIEILSSPAGSNIHHQNQVQNTNSGSSINSQATLMNCGEMESEMENLDSELFDSESMDLPQNSIIGDKLAEINAMKDQLKRLKNMMDTVKLIENKANGPDPRELAQAAMDVDRLCNEPPRKNPPQLQQQQSLNSSLNGNGEANDPVLSDRVQALHAMTQDLRNQAMSLASERDRLRSIKDEMVRRNEEEEKHSSHSGSTIREMGVPSQSQGFTRETSEQRKLKEEYEEKKREFEKIVEKMAIAEHRNTSNPSQQRPEPLPMPCTVKKMSNNQSMMNGFEEGAAGIDVNLEQKTPWRKPINNSNQLVAGQQNNQQAIPTQQQMAAGISQLQSQQSLFQQNSSSGFAVDQQAMFVNNEGFLSNPYYRGGDSILLQQFIQTQQMLINSISQCNQLLWAQQRELNNLNNAVLMLQERFLKQEMSNNVLENNLSSSRSNIANIRSESVPPQASALLGGATNLNHSTSLANNNLNNQSSISSYLRAQSEQPPSSSFFGNGQFAGQQQPMSPVRIYPMYNNSSMFQNRCMASNASNLIHLNNNLANNNTNNLTNNLNQLNNLNAVSNNLSTSSNLTATNNLNSITNNLSSNNRVARVAGNVQNVNHQMHLQQQQQQNETRSHQMFANNILNLNPLNNNLNTNNLNNAANLDHLPPMHHHPHHLPQNPLFNNNVNSLNQQQTTALNNQVPPGNRANNYWDNFRSYSRQNLLSGNSCKSNEESCASSSSNYQQHQPHHYVQAAQNNERPFPMHVGPNQAHCRGILIDLQQTQHPPEFGNNEFINNNINNSFQHHLNNSNVNSIVNNLCNNNNNLDNNQQQANSSGQEVNFGMSNSFPTTNLTLATDILGFHTNPINLGVSEFAAKSKTLSKGNKKRSRQLQNASALFSNNTRPDVGNSSTNDSFDGENLNLASGQSNPDAKSTSKFFESLKENVFMEVSALIESNDLRPYFLIQLFRDLQLMSSSDPMRQKTLQSIHNLYNRYVESTIQEEVSMFGGSENSTAQAISNVQPDELENGSMLLNNLRVDLKMENDDFVGDQGEQSNVDGLQRRIKIQRRNGATDGGSNETEYSMNFPTSSTSSQSTPIRSVMNAVPLMANEDEEDEQHEEKFFPTSSSSGSFSNSLSTDFELIRIVMREVAEYLQSLDSTDTVDERIIQRTATIVLAHLNNSINERLFLTNCRKIDREELLYNLRLFANKKEKFLRKLEIYLKHHIFLSEAKYQMEADQESPNSDRRREEASSSAERDEVENEEVVGKRNTVDAGLYSKKQNNAFSESRDFLEKIPNGMPIVPPRTHSLVHLQAPALAMNPDNGEIPTRDELIPVNLKNQADGNALGSSDDQPEPPVLNADERPSSHRSSPGEETVWVTDEEVEILSTNDGRTH